MEPLSWIVDHVAGAASAANPDRRVRRDRRLVFRRGEAETRYAADHA
jgi:hypothetical protein